MKVVIFEPNPDLSTNPTLVNLIRRLSTDSISVDIYHPGHGRYLPLEIKEKNVKFFDYYYDENIRMWSHLKKNFSVFARLFLENKVIIIAVDPRGVAEAYMYHRLLKVPFVYFSFELFFMDEMHSEKEINLKRKEIKANQKASFTVIQDPERSRILKAENKLHEHRFFYLPVSPSAIPVVKKTSHLRAKFDIPKDKIIVIHSGSFSTWTYSEELIENTEKWPDVFILIIHLRYHPDKEIKRKINNNGRRNILFSVTPYGESDFEEMLGSADIGLTLYKPTFTNPYFGKNIETIGLASGKFSYYMKCGIPTISVRQPLYRELLKTYNFGIDIDDFRELPDALLSIKKNHSTYSHQAKKLFKEKLDFEIYYQELKRKLTNLSKQT